MAPGAAGAGRGPARLARLGAGRGPAGARAAAAAARRRAARRLARPHHPQRRPGHARRGGARRPRRRPAVRGGHGSQRADAPEDAGWHDGVLVIEASEASSRFGHVVAVGAAPGADAGRSATASRSTPSPRWAAQAVLAHPFHPRRPWSGWERAPWRGLEVVSNDTAWGEITVGRGWGRILPGLAALPFDGARTVVGLVPSTPARRRCWTGALRGSAARRAARRRIAGPAARAPLLRRRPRLPELPGRLRGLQHARPGEAPPATPPPTAQAVLAALLDGRAACVFDGVAPAAQVRLAAAARALRLAADGLASTAPRRALWRGGRGGGAPGAASAGARSASTAPAAAGRGPTGRWRPAAAAPGSSPTPW